MLTKICKLNLANCFVTRFIFDENVFPLNFLIYIYQAIVAPCSVLKEKAYLNILLNVPHEHLCYQLSADCKPQVIHRLHCCIGSSSPYSSKVLQKFSGTIPASVNIGSIPKRSVELSDRNTYGCDVCGRFP